MTNSDYGISSLGFFSFSLCYDYSEFLFFLQIFKSNQISIYIFLMYLDRNVFRSEISLQRNISQCHVLRARHGVV